MNYCHKATHRLAMMLDQISLTLHWHSFSGWGRECVEIVFAPKGSQYLINRLFATNYQLDYPRSRTRNHWHSVDAPFQDGAGSISLLFLPLNAANTSFMNVSNQSPHRLPKMQSQKSSTLCWHSFSECGWQRVAIVSASKGSQYVIYGHLQPIDIYVTPDAKSKISDALLMLIFRMGKWPCHLQFCL